MGKASPRRIPVAVVEQVLGLYRDKYFDLNVKHYHEKLIEEHRLEVSYTWVKGLLQGAGLVARHRGPRKKHRRRRSLFAGEMKIEMKEIESPPGFGQNERSKSRSLFTIERSLVAFDL